MIHVNGDSFQDRVKLTAFHFIKDEFRKNLKYKNPYDAKLILAFTNDQHKTTLS